MDVYIDGIHALVVREGETFLGWIEALGVTRHGESLEEVVDELHDAVRGRRHKPVVHATVAARLGA